MFLSILFDRSPLPPQDIRQPSAFPDLNLDQVVQAITAPYADYALHPFFYAPLRDPDLIAYRHEVFRDLEDPTCLDLLRAFAEAMARLRRILAMIEKLDFESHKEGWHLEAALIYGEAVTTLEHGLSTFSPTSRGLRALRDYLAWYVSSPAFQSMLAEARQVKAALATVRYNIVIQGLTFRVRHYEEETDYSIEIERIFEKFRQGAVKDYRLQISPPAGMNHVEAKILEFVTRLYPEPFAALDRFCEHWPAFVDETILRFDREIHFYIAYLDFIAPLRAQGLPFCYPQVGFDKAISIREAFDLALARNLYFENKAVICNDFHLEGAERIFVVTGPNQGGKTTFARTVGQIHYLAALGCPLPGREARLFLPDRVFTHFEREEDIRTQRGKLQDDLQRIHGILQAATAESLLIINEIFASTTVEDSLFLSREIMRQVSERDALAVWVTFLDELATFNEKTVSMVSTVSPENPAERTFRILRRPADGLAYALSLAEKHRLTYAQLKERFRS